MPETLPCSSCWNIHTLTLEVDCLCYHPANTDRGMMLVLQSVLLYILRIVSAVAVKLLVHHHQCDSPQLGLSVMVELVMCTNIVLLPSFSSSRNVESVDGRNVGHWYKIFSVIDLLEIVLVFTAAENFLHLCQESGHNILNVNGLS